MNRRKRNTRGVTLAELCIVMAVIAIVSTMVVSFTVLMQARTRVIAADRDTVSDLGTVESALDRFIRAYDSDEYAIVLSDLLLTSAEDPASSLLDKKYTSISVWKDEAITAKLKLSIDPKTEKVNAIVITDGSDKVTVTYPLYSVTFVSFAIESNDTSALVTATVEYTSTHGSEQVTKKATLCHAVRAMKFGTPSSDLDIVKLAVSEFLKNYGTEDFSLGFARESASSPEGDPYINIVAEAKNEDLSSYGDVYQLLPKYSDGKDKIVALVILASIKSDEKEPQIIVRYPLCNVAKIEYTPKYVNVEGTEQLSYISCKVTYATGETDPVIVWQSPANTATVIPAEGGIEP